MEAYFATKTGVALAKAVMERVREYRNWLRTTGRLTLMQDLSDTYYGKDRYDHSWSSQAVRRDGKKGEILKTKVNHFGSIVRAMVTIVTSKKPAFDAYATNSDASNQAKAIVGNSVAEYVIRKKRFAAHQKKWVRQAILYRASFLSVDWSDHLGEEDKSAPPERDPETLKVVRPARLGDVVLRNHTPANVAFDFRYEDAQSLPWYVCQHWENKYELAAQVTDPAMRARILALSPDKEALENRLTGPQDWGTTHGAGLSDLVPVYRFMHVKSAAAPQGAEAYVLADDIILGDVDPYPYDELLCYRLAPEDMDDSPDGHSVSVDMLAPTEALDASVSMALSKGQASQPKMFVPEAAKMSKKDLGLPFAVLTYHGQLKPDFVNASSTAEDDLRLAQYFQSQLELLTGINPVMRGNAEQSLKGGSGTAYAFLQAQAAVNNSGLEGNTHEASAQAMYGVVQVFRTHAKAKRKLGIIAGKAKAQLVKDEIAGSDLADVAGYTFEVGDPLSRTPSGRAAIAEMLRNLGVKMDPRRAIELITAGTWEPLIEDLQNEDLSIRRENESMSQGQQVAMAAVTENQVAHILGHTLRAGEVKDKPELYALFIEHIQSHLDVYRGADPLLLAINGLPVPPPAGMMPGAEGAPGAGGPPSGPMATPEAPDAPDMPAMPDGAPADPFNQTPEMEGAA